MPINSLLNIAKSSCGAVFDIVFPPRCVLCDEFGPTYLCDRCASKMPQPIPEPICPRCGHHRESLPCVECLGDPPYFVAAMATGEYSGHLQEAIHWLKYRDRPMLAERLGLVLAAYARRHSAALAGLSFDAIVPVPLHPSRQRTRGYNHAERLARVVGRELDIPLRGDLIRRARSTRAQVGLDGDARRNNLIGAFKTDAAKVKGLAIIVVDDVSTTVKTTHHLSNPRSYSTPT